MDPIQLQNALVQVLENAQRFGVTRFERQTLEELPAGLLDRIAGMHSAAMPATVETSETTLAPPIAAPDATARRVPDSHQRPEPQQRPAANQRPEPSKPNEGVPSPASGLAAQPWSLPILDEATRQTRFAELDQQVKACQHCMDIVGYRHQTVFGAGPVNPTVCFMGEAPGADEDRSGQPFVGKAGQLLTKIISAMKMQREEVYILNALKCRPPQNRTPVPTEIDNCRHFVETQLDILQPKFIVCLGAVAVRSILQSSLSIGRLRGRFHEYRGARVVVTYHPSYLLRNESAKRLVWEDMQMLMHELGS